MIQFLTWLMTLLAFLGGLVLGRRKWRGGRSGRRGAMEIPRVWPFDLRRVAGSDERRVWSWLRAVFPEHHVLLKLPVTRFVTPQRPEQSREWFRLLSSVYCTFTICTPDGRVVGCLDVMSGPSGLPRINRQIKETLLEQCGICYWAVPRDRLPDGEFLRAEFLADDQSELDTDPPASIYQPIEDVRQRLHETLDRNREERRFQGSMQSEPADLFPVPDAAATASDPFAPTQPAGLITQPGRLDRHDFTLTPFQRRRAGLEVV
jgi:hypothetical protein